MYSQDLKPTTGAFLDHLKYLNDALHKEIAHRQALERIVQYHNEKIVSRALASIVSNETFKQACSVNSFQPIWNHHPIERRSPVVQVVHQGNI